MSNQPRTHWNAEVYDRIGTPMRRWAQQLIADLHLRGDETVLDAGCGSGSVTFDLLEHLPNGKIYALDSSPDMVAKLQASLDERGVRNVVARQADLTDFALPEPVDVVFSNAVFHWIPDDDGLFSALFRATEPGGRLRAQCGGAGNIDRLMEATHAVQAREPYAQHLGAASEFRKYRTPEQVREAMERNGWRDARAQLFPSDVTFDDHDHAALYLRTIILQRHVNGLPEELGERFLRNVIAETEKRFGAPFIADYVRLDIWATQPR